MKILIFSLLASMLVFASSDFDEGRALYVKADCKECHLQGAKFDPNSINKKGTSFKAKDLKQIKAWVEMCDSNFDTGWFPEEQEKVANYLNKVFYKHK
ncbi:hypothetical protein ACKGJI_07675 [Sulfurospirillum sp. 1307]